MKLDKSLPAIALVFLLCTLLILVNATIRKKINTFEGLSVTIPCTLRKDLEFPGVFRRRKRSAVVDDDFVNTNLWTFRTDDPDEEDTLIGFNQISQSTVAENYLEEDHKIAGTAWKVYDGDAVCHFPFRFVGQDSAEKYHYTCLDVGLPNGICWCSSTPDTTSDKNILFCPCAEPHPGVKLLTVGGPDTGSWCAFPFYYKRNWYKGCTQKSAASRKCWCATKQIYDQNSWGWCPCASSPIRGNWGLWSVWSDCPCGGLAYRYRPCNRLLHMDLVPIGHDLLCPGDHIEMKFCPCSESEMSIMPFRTNHFDIRNRSTATSEGDSGQITINGLKYENAGEYKCKRAQISRGWTNADPTQMELGVYELNVVNRDRLQLLNFDRWEVPADVPHPTYSPFWLWSSWQLCDRCGLHWGEQRQIGFCYVSVGGQEEEIFPCNSSALDWQGIQQPADYMNVKRCRDICEREVEAKFYEALPGLSPPPTEFAYRKVERVEVGANLTFHCNRSSALTPVAWSYTSGEGGARPVQLKRFTEQGNRSSKYVIRGDDSLMLVNVQDVDDGYYSCYVDRRLTATYTVISEEYAVDRLAEMLSDYGIYGSSIALIIAIFLAAQGVWKSRKMSRK